jgi:hypothetical protein
MQYNRPVQLSSTGASFLGLSATAWAVFGWSVAGVTLLFLVLALLRLRPRGGDE